MTAKSSAKTEARGIGVNMLTLVANAALPAFHVQLARFLGAGGYGDYTWSNTFVDLFSIITLFGMDQAVQRQVALALAHAEAEKERTVAAVGTALRVVLTSGVLVGVGIFFAAPYVAAFQGKPQLTAPLRLLALVPIFYHGSTVFIVATQARGVMRWGFWARGVLQPLALLALTTLVLRNGGGVPAACVAVASGMGLVAVAAAFFYSRELPLGPTLRAVVSGPLDRETMWLAVPLVLTNMVWALQGRIDAFFLDHYRGSDEMGAYAACGLYVASISQIRGAFDPVVCALIPPALARGEVAELNRSIQRQTRWVALAALPLCVLFAGFGSGLLAIFGKEFTQGAPAMAILAVGHTVNALSLAAYAVPMSGHARFGTYAALTSVALQSVLLPVLVPRLGLTGAAVASASGIVIAQGVQMAFAYKLTGVHGLSAGLLRVVAAAGGGLLAGRAVFVAVPAGLAARFFSGVGVAAAVYVVLLVVLGLGPEEREALGAVRRWAVARLSRPG